MRTTSPCEEDPETFKENVAYSVKGHKGVAFWAWGWELTEEYETEPAERTGMVIVSMVGDNRRYYVPYEDITELKADAYCGGCGQIGCRASQVG